MMEFKSYDSIEVDCKALIVNKIGFYKAGKKEEENTSSPSPPVLVANSFPYIS